MTAIQGLNIENVRAVKDEGFDGYQIFFTSDGQVFCLLAGNRKKPFPLNVKHQFKEKEACILCGKTIYPAPYGQQLCTYFNGRQNGLLQDLMEIFPAQFT
ncbi:hypothetical protein V1498_13475 [Peribacillus sp. SCS-26]|uniref:hypothetical protein n=1 Tax=Paraperibacillus marinus TaxID=3115295 RepID=UPI003906059F